MLNTMKKVIAYILLYISFDQGLKVLAISSGNIDAILVSWHPTLNYGVTLSLLKQLHPLILAGLQILALLLLLFWLDLPNMSKALCIAGGMSNIIDRILHGYVIDYLQFHLYQWNWPAVVNLADIYLLVGIGLWLWDNAARNTSILTGSKLQSE